MKIIYARQKFDLDEARKSSIMLCGPTPRFEYPYPSWRPDALRFLDNFDYGGLVFVPEDENGQLAVSYTDQVEWEESALTAATVILFWIARKIPEMPGFVTNDEFGTWKKSGKVVLGVPPWAVKVSYQKYYAKKYDIPIFETLEETVMSAMSMDYRLSFLKLLRRRAGPQGVVK